MVRNRKNSKVLKIQHPSQLVSCLEFTTILLQGTTCWLACRWADFVVGHLMVCCGCEAVDASIRTTETMQLTEGCDTDG